MNTCLKCHGGSYEELGKASAAQSPNPHYTHVGDKECTVCHKGHKAPEFFCNDCHQFKVRSLSGSPGRLTRRSYAPRARPLHMVAIAANNYGPSFDHPG